MRQLIKGLAIVSTFAFIFGGSLAQSASAQDEPHHGNQEGQGQMMGSNQQAMMSKMKSMDQELQALVEKMKVATPDEQKIKVMENLLAKMVESRIQMHGQLTGKMMPQMMQHMSEHMQLMEHSGEGSMMGCPMMSGQGQMMGSNQQAMMSKMKSMDQELQALVEKMKVATPDEQKIDVMENLLAKMVESRIQMHAQRTGKMMP